VGCDFYAALGCGAVGLERFESFVERLMEGSFARLFRSPIQPAEIAKRLEREMEAHPTISVGRTYVPNIYEVGLNPADFAEFEPFRRSLEHNMAEFISDLATERGYALVARPKVLLKPDGTAPKRGIEVTAHVSDPPATTNLGNAPKVQGRPETEEEDEQVFPRTHAMPVMSKNRVKGGRPASTVAQPRAALRPVEGDMAGRDFLLTKTLISVGRGLDNDLVIDDQRVSRHHAQITFRYGHYLLRDQRSTNGSFVNDQSIETVVLAPGDRVSFGGFELVFQQE
jgi:hypothetical protein